MNQLTHHDTLFRKTSFSMILIVDSVTGPANIGGLFRLADAFNIEKILFSGSKMNLESRRLLKTSRSAIKNVMFEEKADILTPCSECKTSGYQLFALEITDESTALAEFDFQPHSKIALIIGNEQSGISKEVLKIADKQLHINMFGNNSSMNVVQATAIALYEITKSLSSSN